MLMLARAPVADAAAAAADAASVGVVADAGAAAAHAAAVAVVAAAGAAAALMYWCMVLAMFCSREPCPAVVVAANTAAVVAAAPAPAALPLVHGPSNNHSLFSL